MNDQDPIPDPTVDLSEKKQIHHVCTEFIDEWKEFLRNPSLNRRQPAIQDFLNNRQVKDRLALFRELLGIDVCRRSENGEIPKRDDYLLRFPEYRDVIEEAFVCLREVYEESTSPKSSVTRQLARQEDNSSISSTTRLGKYEVIKTLGRGGQAVTFLVMDPDLKRHVVIKRYHASDSSIEREAVLNEGRALARVQSRYVAKCMGVEHEDGKIYLVMEYIRGTNLSDLLREKEITPDDSAKLIAKVAEGLDEVHLCGVVHRDIKPANIIVRKDGSPRLVDFGFAAMVASDALEQFGGTLQYMPPEQANADVERVDQRSDVFGLGAVMYRLLAGRAPYAGRSVREVWEQAKLGEFKPPSAFNPNIPERLERICLRAMSRNPNKRYRSADSFGRALRRHLRGTFEDRSSTGPSRELTTNPYKGLAAFTEDDAHLFFGRDEQIERLWNAFRDLHSNRDERPGKHRVLPILGPSGSGKSSLARAGLISELVRRPLTGRDRARFVVMTPGGYPLESLAAALARVTTADPSPVAKTREFEDQLRRKNYEGAYDGLRRIADLLPDISTKPIAILVDQFEEVYSLCNVEADRQIFIETLLDAALDVGQRVSVVLTIRSDFLGETQDYQGLNVLIAESGIIVPAMTDAELHQAIARPAERAGRPLNRAEIDLLIKETRDREGALPLLQFALTRIWEGLREGKEPATTLNEIGGVGGALAGEAQRIYEGFNSKEKVIARRALLAMVQLGEGTRDTRRRVPIESIVGLGESVSEVRDVLFKFSAAGARLVTLSANDDGTEHVEVTHEALFDQWQTLNDWLDESRDDIRFHRRLDESTKHWHEKGRPDGLLWRSPDLDYLRQFNLRCSDSLTALQREFFDVADQKERDEQLRVRRRNMAFRIAALIFAVLFVVITGLGRLAFQKADDAKTAEARAVKNAEEANAANRESRRLFYHSQFMKALGDFKQGRTSRTREILNSHRPLDGMIDPRGWEWYYLFGLLHRDEYTFTGHIGAVHHLEWSPQGHFIATAGEDGTVRIWNTRDAKQVLVIDDYGSPMKAVTWAPSGNLIAAGSSDGHLGIWTSSDGVLQGRFLSHQGGVQAVAWQPMGQWIATGGKHGRVRIRDVESGREIVELPRLRNAVNCLSWSPDGMRLAASHGSPDSGDADVTIWDSRTWQIMSNIDEGAQSSHSVSWSPNGQELAFASDLRRIQIAQRCDTNTPIANIELEAHIGRVRSVAWCPSPAANRIASGSDDSTIRIWDRQTKVPIWTLGGHTGPVNSVAWRNDGSRLASGSDDGTIKIWDIDNIGASIQKEFLNWVYAVSLHPTRSWAATACLHPSSTSSPQTAAAPSAIVWNTVTGKTEFELRGHTNRTWTVEWSNDGTKLATGSTDNTVRIWSDSGDEMALLEGLGGAVRFIAWSPDDSMIATVRGSDVRIWDLTTLKERFSVQGDGISPNRGVSWSHDGKCLAIGHLDGRIKFIDAESGDQHFEVQHLRDEVAAISFAPDGMHMALGYKRGVLEVWNWQSRTSRFSLRAHNNTVTSVAWSPDSTRIVTGSNDGTTKLFDAQYGDELLVIQDSAGEVKSVDWSADGRRIASGTWAENLVRIWDSSAGQKVAESQLSLADWYRDRGLSLIREGNLTEANRFAQRLTHFSNSLPVTLLYQADIYQAAASRIGDSVGENVEQGAESYTDRAVSALRKCIDAEPGYADVIASSPTLSLIWKNRDRETPSNQLSANGETKLVDSGSVWKYFDGESSPGEQWHLPAFDDADWESGPSPLGYGDSDESTVVNRTKHPTVYFRRQFDIPNRNHVQDMVLGLSYDDGAIVYLNGVEILRVNLDKNATAESFAIETADDATPFEYYYDVDLTLLRSGGNTLAVEVHQANPNSSDITFDLTLATNRVSYLAARLSDATSAKARRKLIEQIGRFQHRASHVVSTLLRCLNDPDPLVRRAAIQHLPRVHPEGPDLIPALAKCLDDVDISVRNWAARSISRIRDPQTTLVTQLLNRLVDADMSDDYIETLCKVAGLVGQTSDDVTQRLKDLTRHNNPRIAAWALATLLQVDSEWVTQNHDLRGEHSSQLSEVARSLAYESWRIASRADMTSDDYQRAARAARAAIILRPDNAMLHDTLGLSLYRNGDIEGAVEALVKCQDMLVGQGRSSSRVNQMTLALAYNRLKMTKKMSEILNRIPPPGSAATSQGIDDVESLKNEMVSVATDHISKHGDSDKLFAHRAAVFAWLGDHTARLDDLDRAVELARKPEHFMSRADLHFENRNYALAIEDFTIAIALGTPQVEHAHHYRGHSHHYLAKWKEAVDDFTVVVESLGTKASAHLHFSRAESLLELSEFERAKYDAGIAVQKQKYVYQHQLVLGEATYGLGDYETALGIFEFASHVNKLTKYLPSNEDGSTAFDLFPRSMCHQALGNDRQATLAYERAVDWLEERSLGPATASRLNVLREKSEKALGLSVENAD